MLTDTAVFADAGEVRARDEATSAPTSRSFRMTPLPVVPDICTALEPTVFPLLRKVNTHRLRRRGSRDKHAQVPQRAGYVAKWGKPRRTMAGVHSRIETRSDR